MDLSKISPNQLSRRAFLRTGVGSAAALAALTACRGSSDTAATAPTSGPTETGGATTTPRVSSDAKSGAKATSDMAKRRLVVIEMEGGNDGMSTLVPYGIGTYRDVRPRTAIPEDQLLTIDGTFAVPKTLEAAHKAGLAYIMGVGVPEPDGSHFAMMERWWRGDVRPSTPLDTGFLGRLADVIGDPAARAVALSIGSGSHPMLLSSKAPTMSIPRADIANNLVGADAEDRVRFAFQQNLAAMARESSASSLAAARRSLGEALQFAQSLAELAEESEDSQAEYPGGQLSDGLRLAARVFTGDEGVRIIHVPMGGGFDTHSDHAGTHSALMTDFSSSLAAFLKDLAARGLDDQVLVITTSEFGRTVGDNASNGLDHGTASVTMMAGPVNAGLYGEYSSLTDLDDNKDLKATMTFDSYYATVAESWFGVPASDVLDGNPTALTGVIRS